MVGCCVVDAAPDSLAAGDPALACATTAAPCDHIAPDASARCVWETEACVDGVCSCGADNAPFCCRRRDRRGNFNPEWGYLAPAPNFLRNGKRGGGVLADGSAGRRDLRCGTHFGAASRAGAQTHKHLRGPSVPPAPMPEPSAEQKTLTLQCGSCTESLPAAVLTGGTSSVDLMTLRSFHRVVQFHYWPWPKPWLSRFSTCETKLTA
jgi:hypothetical protein